MRARSTHRRISISMACIRIIYSARASLTAPTVTGRSSGRFSARMTVYEPLFCANFSFSLFFFFIFRFPPLLFFSPTPREVATTHVFCCSQTFPLEISVFQTSRKMKEDRRSRHNERIHFGLYSEQIFTLMLNLGPFIPPQTREAILSAT